MFLAAIALAVGAIPEGLPAAVTLPTNAGQSLIILASVLTGLALPALRVQLLWVNMATSVFLGLPLAFEPGESDLMARRPRDPRKPILTFPLFMRTGLVSLIILAGAFGLFYWEHGAEGRNLGEARTAVVNVIVMVQAFYLLNSRSLSRAMFSIGLFSNRWVWRGLAGMTVAQLLFTYAPFMNQDRAGNVPRRNVFSPRIPISSIGPVIWSWEQMRSPGRRSPSSHGSRPGRMLSGKASGSRPLRNGNMQPRPVRSVRMAKRTPSLCNNSGPGPPRQCRHNYLQWAWASQISGAFETSMGSFGNGLQTSIAP